MEIRLNKVELEHALKEYFSNRWGGTFKVKDIKIRQSRTEEDHFVSVHVEDASVCYTDFQELNDNSSTDELEETKECLNSSKSIKKEASNSITNNYTEEELTLIQTILELLMVGGGDVNEIKIKNLFFDAPDKVKNYFLHEKKEYADLVKKYIEPNQIKVEKD